MPRPAKKRSASGTPAITMAPSATVGLQAVLAVSGGGPLPGAVFSWSVDEGGDGDQFSLSGSDLTALDAATGSATVTARDNRRWLSGTHIREASFDDLVKA